MDEYNDMTQKEIIDLLKFCDDEYYNSSSTIMDDDSYDKLKTLAKKNYPDDPYFLSVGASVKGKKKVKLPYIMGSLTKYKSEGDDIITKWMRKYPKNTLFTISSKIDGCSLFIVYQGGEVSFASTRGDGYEGFDVTQKAKLFCPKIDKKYHYVFKAEAIWKDDSYKALGFANPRNATAGVLNRDDTENADKLVLIIHGIVETDDPDFNEKKSLQSESIRISLIKKLGFVTPKEISFEFDYDDEYAINALKEILIHFKAKSSFNIDGLVVTVDNAEYEDVFYPENKVAFKVNEEAVTAIIDRVEWAMSRTGRCVPTVVLNEEVELCGTMVSRATAHNAKYVLDNKITQGTEIKIVKSGDIIPYIEQVLQ